MDIDTKEAILKMAGWTREWGWFQAGRYYCWIAKDAAGKEVAKSFDRDRASITNMTYNVFLTRQNDVVETS